MCVDDNGSSSAGIFITNGEYGAALNATADAAGKKLDIVTLEMCIEGGWETADVTAAYADYLIASPASHYGFTYDTYSEWFGLLVDNLDTITPLQWAIALIDYYGDPSNGYTAVTQSVIDLSTMSSVESAMTDFADALMAAEQVAKGEFYDDLAEARGNSQCLDRWYGLIDIYDFAWNATKIDGVPQGVTTAANSLMDQLGETIVYNFTNPDQYPGSTGLWTYLPSPRETMRDMYRDLGAVWSQNTTWDEFVESFAAGGADRCESTPVIDFVGDAVSDTASLTEPFPGPGFAQPFMAPDEFLHGVAVWIFKPDAEEGEESMKIGIYDPNAEQYLNHDTVFTRSFEVNPDDPTMVCLPVHEHPVTPGNTYEIHVFGSADVDTQTETQFPVTAPAPYAPIHPIDEDGVQTDAPVNATLWFAVY
jgi:hypothetical protein